MENASKALLMAAGVLLGMLLLSVMIYVFRQGARVNQTYDQKQITNQLELYNSRFEQYDRDNNNIMDVISLCNLAFDVNMASSYDSTNAVQIEIQIGSTHFKIPNSYCPTCNNIENYNLKENKCTACVKFLFTQRNKIIKGNNNPSSIYDLVDLNLANLGINSITQKDDLFPGLDPKNVTVDKENDKLSTTKLDNNGKTIYKYLFCIAKPEDFEYHVENMKVSRIKLTAYCNPDWD